MATVVDEKYFGGMLRLFRTKKGMSLREVAQRCGISAPYLSDIERGYREPPYQELLEKLMDVLALQGKTRFQLECMAYIERKKISEDLVEYLCVQAPASLEFIKKAKELKLSNEYFQVLTKVLEPAYYMEKKA